MSEKIKSKEMISKHMISAIIALQIFGLACFILLMINLNRNFTTYRDVNVVSNKALVALETIRSSVYKHESFVSRYILTDNREEWQEYEAGAAGAEASLRDALAEAGENFAKIGSDSDLEKLAEVDEAVNAYINASAIAMDVRRNESFEVASFVLNNNMSFYIDSANASMEELEATAMGNLDMVRGVTQKNMQRTNITFFIGILAFLVMAIVCVFYCKGLLKTLAKYMDEAESANKAKSAFLSSMSHEIRTPINAVIGMNEMIRRESSRPEVLEYSSKIGASSRALLGLINDILDISKIEEGKMELVIDQYRLDDLLYDTWILLENRAREKELDFSIQVPPDAPRNIVGDVTRIRQILVNLLTNAVKYTKEGSVALQVRYGIVDSDKVAYTFEIHDTGMGIRKEDISKLTGVFVRVNESATKNIEGTGLGLSIVRNLLELMGSQLEIQSEYGRGSKFSFTLIQTMVGCEPIGEFDPIKRIISEEEEDNTALYAPEAKILVVDDNDINRMVAAELLKRTGIQIDMANGGQQSIDMAAVNKYDVILMDHRMPGIDGVEAMHAIKDGDGACKNVPIIVVTANALSGMDEQYLKEGFDDVVMKPIEYKELEHKLRQHLPKELVGSIEITRDQVDQQEANTSGETPGGPVYIDEEAGSQACGDREVFLKVAEEFAKSSQMLIDEIRGYYDRENYGDYTIKVHALKSSARLIGAQGLSDEAKYLEACGNEGNIDEIKSKTDELLQHYREVAELIRTRYGIKEEHTEGMIDDILLRELLGMIRQSAESFDFDSVDAAVAEMDKYDLPEGLEPCRQPLRDAAYAIDQEAINRVVHNMETLLNQ